jgi:His/Glu/Gln/Arg/opine family amino acid ABC transporter permease subunit
MSTRFLIGAGRELLLGAGVTIALSMSVIVVSTSIGLVLACLRLFGGKPLQVAVATYAAVIRGVPLLILLLGGYFSLPYLGIDLPLPLVVIAIMGLYFGAYMSEVFRGAIAAVPRPQWDAGRSVGFRRFQVLWIVILPQASSLCVAPFLNTSLVIVKNTSLVSAIGGWELVTAGREIGERTTDVLPVYLAIAACYFAICFPLSWLARRIEGRATHV